MSNTHNFAFLSARKELRDIYGIVMTEDSFLNIALSAYDAIGNINTTIKKIVVKPRKVDRTRYCIDKPCDCSFIESVSIPGPHSLQSTNKNQGSVSMANGIEESVESELSEEHPHSEDYTPGVFIHYEEYEDTIMVHKPYKNVMVIYQTTEEMDGNLPRINALEKEALVMYCIYIHYMKDSIRNSNMNTIQVAQLWEKKWQLARKNALNAEYLNQNEIDIILQAKTSLDRKQHNISYKISK